MDNYLGRRAIVSSTTLHNNLMSACAVLLTEDELILLTGRRRPSAQIRALRNMGIEHRVRPDGTPAVSRAHVESLLSGARHHSIVDEGAEPNWEAM